MKSTLILVGVLCMAVAAQAGVVGVDSTAGSDWRTAAALDADMEYGTDGYIVYGLNVADGQYIAPFDAAVTNTTDNMVSLPGYVSDITLSGATNMWSGNGNFGSIQNPANGDALENTSLLAGGDPMTYTIVRSSDQAFRLTVMLADGDGAGVTYTTSIGNDTQSYTHVANGLAYHVYDIAAGTDDVLLTVDSDNNNFNATGIAFDAVPEPMSMLLMGLGGLGLLRKRK